MNDSPRRLSAILWNRAKRLHPQTLYALVLDHPHGVISIDGQTLTPLRLPSAPAANDN